MHGQRALLAVGGWIDSAGYQYEPVCVAVPAVSEAKNFMAVDPSGSPTRCCHLGNWQEPVRLVRVNLELWRHLWLAWHGDRSADVDLPHRLSGFVMR